MSSFMSVVIIIISFTQIAQISVFKILAELFFPSHNCVCGTITGEETTERQICLPTKQKQHKYFLPFLLSPCQDFSALLLSPGCLALLF